MRDLRYSSIRINEKATKVLYDMLRGGSRLDFLRGV